MTEHEQMLITKYDLLYEQRITKVETTLDKLEKNLDNTFKTLENNLDNRFRSIDDTLKEIKHDIRWMFGIMLGFSGILLGLMAHGFHWY